MGKTHTQNIREENLQIWIRWDWIELLLPLEHKTDNHHQIFTFTNYLQFVLNKDVCQVIYCLCRFVVVSKSGGEQDEDIQSRKSLSLFSDSARLKLFIIISLSVFRWKVSTRQFTIDDDNLFTQKYLLYSAIRRLERLLTNDKFCDYFWSILQSRTKQARIKGEKTRSWDPSVVRGDILRRFMCKIAISFWMNNLLKFPLKSFAWEKNAPVQRKWDSQESEFDLIISSRKKNATWNSIREILDSTWI